MIMTEKYDPKEIEAKWQRNWEEKGIYKAEDFSQKKKFFPLAEFPFPSGAGLHTGHVRSYTAMDIVARKHRMEGENVLYPIGWDAFGLPTENYAIKTGIHPQIVTKQNTDAFRTQFKELGMSFDWSREVNTSDPAYYKWTQWIFIQMFKKGLAYKDKILINWCPKDKIGLANEEVVNGQCERCGTTVEKREKEQWMLRITKYADRLLKDLDATDYKMPLLVDDANPHVEGKPIILREVVHAIVFDPKKNKYLIIRNKKFGWDTTIIGGIEDGEDAVEAALRELKEETGYTDLEFKRLLGGKTEAHYYTKHKGENRIAYAQGVLFELKSEERVEIGTDEDKDNEVLWIDEADFVPGKIVNSEMGIWLERIKDPNAGWPKPVLDWPESIKESQRNWIGRSEGSEIDFKIMQDGAHLASAAVFTTRADTLFGVTYVVLAPEHILIKKLLEKVSNINEVGNYIQTVKAKSEIERTDATKEKVGIELKGIKAINPANNEEVPVWIADYVLADYGTGAVMAVPAHDERDFEFAKKYNLPFRQVVAPNIVLQGKHTPREGVDFLERRTVTVILENKKGEIAVIFEPDTITLIGGGMEEGETPEETACREVKEETGYRNIEIKKRVLESYYCFGYRFTKNKNQKTNDYIIHALLLNEEQDKSEIEEGRHSIKWISKDEVSKIIPKAHHHNHIFELFLKPVTTDEGILLNSGVFNELASREAKKKITEAVSGRLVTKYKLRDWVFSRQRYWGEPIPMVHCVKCGWQHVSEDQLPVILPEAGKYEPTDTGESPLSNMKEWLKTECPSCKGNAERETDTMPNWAGSSWYYLRYVDSHNTREFADRDLIDYWTPVDWYNGGMEHTTLHLLYSRFWHKFLYDIGKVPTNEPYTRRSSHGLVLAEDGEKMSKSKGNVVNPKDGIEIFGADALRLYEMFMGPFDQAIAWNTNGLVGTCRFIEKVWRLKEKVSKKVAVQEGGQPASSTPLVHRTIKKVTEDIEAMKFNTAVSTLMIFANELEKSESITQDDFEALLKLLAPFAPHVTEELWHEQGNENTIHLAQWPLYDLTKLEESTASVAIQINGKTREVVTVPSDLSEEEAKGQALALPGVQKWIAGSEIKKVIWVKNRILNLVIDL
jgi:leucyl-tRNA synthetase